MAFSPGRYRFLDWGGLGEEEEEEEGVDLSGGTGLRGPPRTRSFRAMQ